VLCGAAERLSERGAREASPLPAPPAHS
jgi:hypothetical protein